MLIKLFILWLREMNIKLLVVVSEKKNYFGQFRPCMNFEVKFLNLCLVLLKDE